MSDGDPPSAGPRAVVAAHGDLAAGFVSAVAAITGHGDLLVPLTNRGLGGEQLEQTLRETLTASGARLVFTDLPAGSWTIAARRVQRADPSVVLVAGVSLPVLLAWVTGGAHDAEGSAAEAAAEKGRRALLVSGGAAAPGAAGGD
jgi:PTS system N-acetylgalactosamine-specific IIA component